MFYIGSKGVVEAEPVGKFNGFVKIRTGMGEFFVPPERAESNLVNQLQEDADSATYIEGLRNRIAAK